VLFEYFASELFDRAPPAARRFLLETALLPRMSVQAAEDLTGDAGAGEILSTLVRRNYFTVRLSGHEGRYRYHPLFREFLMARSRKGHSGSSGGRSRAAPRRCSSRTEGPITPRR